MQTPWNILQRGQPTSWLAAVLPGCSVLLRPNAKCLPGSRRNGSSSVGMPATLDGSTTSDPTPTTTTTTLGGRLVLHMCGHSSATVPRNGSWLRQVYEERCPDTTQRMLTAAATVRAKSDDSILQRQPHCVHTLAHLHIIEYIPADTVVQVSDGWAMSAGILRRRTIYLSVTLKYEHGNGGWAMSLIPAR